MTGFYLGGHGGYSWADVSSEFAFPGDPYPTTKTNGPIRGVHVGYQRQLLIWSWAPRPADRNLQNSDNGVPYPLAIEDLVGLGTGEVATTTQLLEPVPVPPVGRHEGIQIHRSTDEGERS